VLADDGAWTWEGRVVLKGGLERGELLVFVVAVDGDLLDQAVELGVGLGRADGGLLLSGGWGQALQQQGRALADLA